MNLYTELLFLHGHVAQPELARSLADAPVPSGQEREPRRRGRAGQSVASAALKVALGRIAASIFASSGR